MNKKLLIGFAKDKLGLTVIFFANSILVGLFYYLSTDSEVEILYPATISLFVYTILMIIEWFKFSRFNSKLILHGDDMYYDFEPISTEQRNVSKVIDQIHKTYEERIFKIQLENQNRKHFTSQWIHNMKTPVSVIDLIIQKALSDEAYTAETLKNIKEENEKLLSNLEQVLDLTRLEDFSKDYVPASTDLVTSVKKMINSRKNQFIYNRIYPKLQTFSDSVNVLSDTKWNEVIIDQLVSNAIKYSPNDKNLYFIIESKNDQVSLTIKDEGIGIPKHDLKRVFEPFFTGDNGRTHRNATGIGLYICATVAEKLGHSIDIKSEPGIGTEVVITYLTKV